MTSRPEGRKLRSPAGAIVQLTSNYTLHLPRLGEARWLGEKRSRRRLGVILNRQIDEDTMQAPTRTRLEGSDTGIVENAMLSTTNGLAPFTAALTIRSSVVVPA